MEWISVKDKLPKYDEAVIGLLKGEHKHVAAVMRVSTNKRGENWESLQKDILFQCGSDNQVTHWMPLPNPPTK